jgi:hypothetical protein
VDVFVIVEVSGCLTTCMHCWALGRHYRTMPIEDAAFVLTELASFCGQRGLDYATYPMHEVTAHPAAPDMIRLFAPHLGEAYDPILTPGTPLATRPDWAQVMTAAQGVRRARAMGRLPRLRRRARPQLNRPGAFEETCMAVRRAQDCGLGTGANVFLTKPALADLDRLLGTLVDLRLRMFYIAVAGFTPTARGRRYEALRPDLADLLPVAQRVLDESCLLREQWGSLESHTEAAWVRQLARSRDRLLHQRVPSAGLSAEPRPAHRDDRHLPAPPREPAP